MEHTTRVIVKLNDGIAISKKRWNPFERKLLKSGGSQMGFVLIAIDTVDGGIARLRGTHLEFMPNIYSGSGGKRYKTAFNIERFFDNVLLAVSSIFRKGDTIVVFGPGETKKRFVNYMAKAQKAESGAKTITVEGIDTGGEDGIYIFTKSQMMQDIMSESKLAKASSIIDEVMILATKKSAKFTMGYKEAVPSKPDRWQLSRWLFSEKAIQENGEQAVMDFLNDAEAKGVRVYSVDSSTDVGLRVTGLGGIVSLLRYAV